MRASIVCEPNHAANSLGSAAEVALTRRVVSVGQPETPAETGGDAAY